jgi:hypothetical protein
VAAVYRSMYPDGGSPQVGNESCQLGSRERDVAIDQAGNVSPGAGMSVSICACRMLPHLIPIRLQSIFRQAIGRGKRSDLVIWLHGDGEWVSGALGDRLYLSAGPSHGQLEPAGIMSKVDFDQALASTKSDWQKNETHSKNCEKMGHQQSV